MDGLLREGSLMGIGNPLLDMTVKADDELLAKWCMKPNDAILAEDRHMVLYEELVREHKVEYTAGGSSQNSLRVAQWILKKPNVAVLLGCVGRDNYSQILEDKAREDGLNVQYQYNDNVPTGRCAVLITKNGANRSLCAHLAAANCFTKDHIHRADIKKLIHQAEFYYSSGFFLTVSIESILEIAQIALQRNKLFMMNLSAPFLTQIYKEQMMQALPYVDILFGNDEEALAFSKEQNLGTTNVPMIALKIAELPKQNTDRTRTVVITQGIKPVILAKDGWIKEFPVKEVLPEKIVDTNGAGDAFVGGFLAQLVQGNSLDTSIQCGIWAAAEIVQRSGCTFTALAKFQE